MKRGFHLFPIALLCLFSISSCGFQLNGGEIESNSEKNKFFPNYQVFVNQEEKYEYVIYDIDHNLLDKVTWEYGEPQITNLSSTVYKVSLPDGTNPVKCVYYDIVSKKISPIYECPYDESEDGLVAFFVSPEEDIYDVKLRICDIFHPDIFSVDISRDFVSIIYPAECVKFLYRDKIYMAYQTFETGNIDEMIQGGDYSFKIVEEIIEFRE